jgi:hypothetical protein
LDHVAPNAEVEEDDAAVIGRAFSQSETVVGVGDTVVQGMLNARELDRMLAIKTADESTAILRY